MTRLDIAKDRRNHSKDTKAFYSGNLSDRICRTNYLVEPYGPLTGPEETVLLGDRDTAVSQGSTNDRCCGIREVIVAHGTPHAVMTHLHPSLHGITAVRQAQLERRLKSRNHARS